MQVRSSQIINHTIMAKLIQYILSEVEVELITRAIGEAETFVPGANAGIKTKPLAEILTLLIIA